MSKTYEVNISNISNIPILKVFNYFIWTQFLFQFDLKFILIIKKIS